MTDSELFTLAEQAKLRSRRRYLPWRDYSSKASDPFENAIYGTIGYLTIEGDSGPTGIHSFLRLYCYAIDMPLEELVGPYLDFHKEVKQIIKDRSALALHRYGSIDLLTTNAIAHADEAWRLFGLMGSFTVAIRTHVAILGDVGRDNRRNHMALVAHLQPLLELRNAVMNDPTWLNAQRFVAGSRILIESPHMLRLLKRCANTQVELNRLRDSQEKLEDALMLAALDFEANVTVQESSR